MGMDIYGKNPSSEEGSYFRNNIWYWRPLWWFCEHASPKVTAKVSHSQSNDGDGLNAKDTLILAKDIKRCIDDGTLELWALEYQQHKDSLPLQKCTYCNETGFRTWEPNTFQNDTDQPIIKPCNVCKGEGEYKDDLHSYPFSIDNVHNFLKFLESSGGFEIW